ncbi:MAG: hypothetical protein Q9160_009015 [Pyrenula sp. 1 TL-2023]
MVRQVSLNSIAQLTGTMRQERHWSGNTGSQNPGPRTPTRSSSSCQEARNVQMEDEDVLSQTAYTQERSPSYVPFQTVYQRVGGKPSRLFQPCSTASNRGDQEIISRRREDEGPSETHIRGTPPSSPSLTSSPPSACFRCPSPADLHYHSTFDDDGDNEAEDGVRIHRDVNEDKGEEEEHTLVSEDVVEDSVDNGSHSRYDNNDGPGAKAEPESQLEVDRVGEHGNGQCTQANTDNNEIDAASQKQVNKRECALPDREILPHSYLFAT